MRGQYRVWVPSVSVGTSEGIVFAFSVPANTVIEVNSAEFIGGDVSASRRVRWRLRRATGSPVLNTGGGNALNAVAVDDSNAIPSSLTFARAWTTAPSGYQNEILPGQLEAWGGRDRKQATLQEALARLGGTSQLFYEVSALASAATSEAAFVLTFTE